MSVGAEGFSRAWAVLGANIADIAQSTLASSGNRTGGVMFSVRITGSHRVCAEAVQQKTLLRCYFIIVALWLFGKTRKNMQG